MVVVVVVDMVGMVSIAVIVVMAVMAVMVVMVDGHAQWSWCLLPASSGMAAVESVHVVGGIFRGVVNV